jgi:DNA-binding NarL/FixJ family response regulator
MNIFLVEDSAVIRERLIEMIESRGDHVIGTADNFEDALAGIAAQTPDVAIFDVKLARGTGIEALAAAKQRDPGLVGIVMSNYATPQHRKASLAAGALCFLDKSCDFDDLPRILRGVAERRRTGVL